MTLSPEKVLCAMSGGVDSSVAAFLLTENGYRVTGMTMMLFGYSLLGEELESRCCSVDDVEDAKQVCRRLGIPHYTFNFKQRFREDVVDRFCGSYICGRTPNPCIDCNRFLKFEALQQRRRELDMDYVATGHYARRTYDESTGRWQLRRGLDANKDQSYVLYHLTQSDLEHMLFPLGGFKKSEIRTIAENQGFSNAEKPESQDICFVPDGDYASFIARYIGQSECESSDSTGQNPPEIHSAFQPGEIVDEHGRLLGKHSGLVHYTVGQRKGLGIAAPEPLYVMEKDSDNNRLIVSPRIGLLTDTVHIDDVNTISGDAPDGAVDVDVKLSYRQSPVPASFEMIGDAKAIIHLHEPQVRPAAGQSAVAYIGDAVLAGGTVFNP